MKKLGPERVALIQETEKEIEVIDKEIQENQEIANDENEQSAVREQAHEKIRQRTEQRNALENERERLKEGMPLRERVKEIFKKYGVTVTAIFLAAGVTIGAVIGAITNSLKATGKALGKGLKDVGSKVPTALPGLIGLIVSFLFKAAGQAIGFLAEQTWLLILAVVAFLVETTIKKQR